MDKLRGPYEILGIDKFAARAEIIAAYRRLAMKWHPDRNPSPAAHARFQEIQDAYQVLQSRPTLWEAMPPQDTQENWRDNFPFIAVFCLIGGGAALFFAWPENLVLFSLAVTLAYYLYKTATSPAARRAEYIFRLGVKLYWTGLLVWGIWTMGRRVAGI